MATRKKKPATRKKTVTKKKPVKKLTNGGKKKTKVRKTKSPGDRLIERRLDKRSKIMGRPKTRLA